MILKLFRIALFSVTFIFLTGFLPFSAMLGPGITIASSGNVYKASAQFLIDHQIKKKTGKNSFDYVKEEVTKKNINTDVNEELRKLVEARIKIVHKKLIQQNSQKEFKQLLEKRIKIAHKKLNLKKINQ